MKNKKRLPLWSSLYVYLLACVADPFLVATEDASFVELYLFYV